jgi:hypothetical protein
MCIRTLLALLLGFVQISISSAAGCGNITLCVKNPPVPPEPPSCVTYPNVCSEAPPDTSAAASRAYSIQLDNLSPEMLAKSLDALGIDKTIAQPPR